MEPENKDIEIKAVEANEAFPPPAAFSSKAGGKAEVNLRLLTQEEFDRREAEKLPEKAESEGLRDPLRDRG